MIWEKLTFSDKFQSLESHFAHFKFGHDDCHMMSTIFFFQEDAAMHLVTVSVQFVRLCQCLEKNSTATVQSDQLTFSITLRNSNPQVLFLSVRNSFYKNQIKNEHHHDHPNLFNVYLQPILTTHICHFVPCFCSSNSFFYLLCVFLVV